MAPKRHSLSIDVVERREEARKQHVKNMERDPDKYKDDADDAAGAHDYSAKALDMQHVRALADLIGYCVFLVFIMCVVFMNPAEYHANKIIDGSVGALNNTLVTNAAGMWAFLDQLNYVAHATEYYNGSPFLNQSQGEYQAYWMGDLSNNLALGRIRLRQLRLGPGDTCTVPESFEGKITRCNADAGYSGNLQRSGVYEAAGGFRCEYEVHGDGYDWFSGSTKIKYPSEGFVVELPLEPSEASTQLTRLQEFNWCDDRTRAVFAEFSLYNANVDHFAVVRYAFEFLPSGLVVPSMVLDSVPLLGDLRVFTGDGSSAHSVGVISMEFALYAAVLAYLTKVADVAADAGSIRAFLKNGWNILDLLNVWTFSCLVVVRAIYTLRTAALTYAVNGLDKNNEPVDLDDDSDDYNTYFRVRQTVELWRVGRNLLALGVFINFGRAFKYVRASRRLSQLSETISTALPDLGWLSVIFLILFTGYLLALRLLVGPGVAGYADFIDGCFSLLSVILGDFSLLDSMLALSPVLMPLLFVAISVNLIFVMLTLILKTVDSAFVSVMEKQRYEKDRFIEELKEAAYLFGRECWQTVASPVQLWLMKRRMRGRLEGSAVQVETANVLQRKRQALQESKAKYKKKGGSKVHPTLPDVEAADGAAAAAAGADGGGAKAKKVIAGSAPTHKGGPVAEVSDMERLTDLKTRLSSGRFVKEEEVKAQDVVETVAYLSHRQGVLLRRLKALASTVEQHEPLYEQVDLEDESEVDEGDFLRGGGGMDPSEDTEVAKSFPGTNLHFKGTEVVAQQQQPPKEN